MKVAVGVTGGISAYKAAELVRELQQKGLEVQVIMTAHAQEFVRPLTFAALTGQKVITQMFGAQQQEANVESAIEHIAVAQSIDLLVVAPATADVLAKMAQGIADDFLTTLYLATRAPVVVAPAMNVNMWEHPATQENLERLRQRGVHVVEPDSGYLACGMTGPGRLASTGAIVERVAEVLGLRQDLKNEVVLVTAGPTREAIDPIRYISNRSSGKMGYAVAEAAQRRGARSLLVSGPTALRPPEGIELIPVTTAAEMLAAVLKRLPEATVVVKAAAVADFRPQKSAPQKIRKSNRTLSLLLEPTEDILSEIVPQKGDRIVVGFAAETENLLASARAKLKAKHLDLMVANDVSQSESGIDSDFNTVTILGRNGLEKHLPRLQKIEVANEILNEVVKLRSHGKTGKPRSH
ncbi:MAG: bifunctional phosphopantothenoylcysteine decarboxylase/phosphopantothenate--cysteine ligase CoaBC [Acidobacteria bacterium]|nr:bifunctional phosphopantothenoylcysteine decarboxylase/phosphopantothenate--cysteine ligase CoaBC [Acidobacteriota bacterium]